MIHLILPQYIQKFVHISIQYESFCILINHLKNIRIMWVLRKEIIAKHGIVLYVIGRTQTLRGVAL